MYILENDYLFTLQAQNKSKLNLENLIYVLVSLYQLDKCYQELLQQNGMQLHLSICYLIHLQMDSHFMEILTLCLSLYLLSHFLLF